MQRRKRRDVLAYLEQSAIPQTLPHIPLSRCFCNLTLNTPPPCRLPNSLHVLAPPRPSHRLGHGLTSLPAASCLVWLQRSRAQSSGVCASSPDSPTHLPALSSRTCASSPVSSSRAAPPRSLSKSLLPPGFSSCPRPPRHCWMCGLIIESCSLEELFSGLTHALTAAWREQN